MQFAIANELLEGTDVHAFEAAITYVPRGNAVTNERDGDSGRTGLVEQELNDHEGDRREDTRRCIASRVRRPVC